MCISIWFRQWTSHCDSFVVGTSIPARRTEAHQGFAVRQRWRFPLFFFLQNFRWVGFSFGENHSVQKLWKFTFFPNIFGNNTKINLVVPKFYLNPRHRLPTPGPPLITIRCVVWSSHAGLDQYAICLSRTWKSAKISENQWFLRAEARLARDREPGLREDHAPCCTG